MKKIRPKLAHFRKTQYLWAGQTIRRPQRGHRSVTGGTTAQQEHPRFGAVIVTSTLKGCPTSGCAFCAISAFCEHMLDGTYIIRGALLQSALVVPLPSEGAVGLAPSSTPGY